MTDQDSKALRTLVFDATKENLAETFTAAQKIAAKYPETDKDAARELSGYFEQLSMVWMSYFPGIPIPGSPAAELANKS